MRQFSVNGISKDYLEQVLKVAFMQDDDMFNRLNKSKLSVGYKISEKSGIILYDYKTGNDQNMIPFMSSLDYIAVLEQVWTWLQSNPKVELTGKDKENTYGDGSSKRGWRVYL